MSLTYANRVAETVLNAGAATFRFQGVLDARHQTFAQGAGNGATVPYAAVHRTSGQWEYGYGIVTAGSPDTLTRVAILKNNAGGTSTVNFSPGIVDVFMDVGAELMVSLDPASAPTAAGDMHYAAGVGGTLTKIAIGAENAVMAIVGGIPRWVTSLVLAGSLMVNGAATLQAASATTLTTTRATTLDTTGLGSSFGGALNVIGNLSIATNKFTVASATGNTAVAGTLNIGGAATLSSTLGIGGITYTFPGSQTSAAMLTTNGSGVLSWTTLVAPLVAYTSPLSGAVATTVQGVLQGTVSVKDFGAVGNGVVDDTAAIQAAMRASPSVFIPDGTYKITSALPLAFAKDQHIWGASKAGAIIQLTGAGCNGFTEPLTIGESRCVIENMSIKGDATTGSALYFPTKLLYLSEFRNLLIDVGGDGVYMQNEFSTLLDNVYVNSATGHAFNMNGGNTTTLRVCYAGVITTPGKVGFLIAGGATLIACNGVNAGTNWGRFGQTFALDGVNTQYAATLIGCNVEAFTDIGIRFVNEGVCRIIGGKFEQTTGTYTACVTVESPLCQLYIDDPKFFTTPSNRTKLSDIWASGSHYPIFIGEHAYNADGITQIDANGTLQAAATIGSAGATVLSTNGAASSFGGALSVGGMLTVSGSAQLGGTLNGVSRALLGGGTGTPNASWVLTVAGGFSLTGVSQVGVLVGQTFNSLATTSATGIVTTVGFAAGSYNVTTAYGLDSQPASIGGGVTIGTLAGLHVGNLGNASVTNAYGMDIAAQTGATTLNYALRLRGGSPALFIDAGGATISGLITANSGLTVAGGQTLTLTSATVAGAPTWSNNQAITLSTAAQPSVTSVGTLTSLAVSGQLTLSGTYTSARGMFVIPNLTAVAGQADGVSSAPTLIASANNDVLVGILSGPAFTPGAFTGVVPYGMQIIAFSTAAFTSPGDPAGLRIGVVTGTGATNVSGLHIDIPTGGANNYLIRAGTIATFNVTSVGALTLASTARVGGPLTIASGATSVAGAGTDIVLGATTQTTIGANGGASALTVLPLGYLVFFKGATKCVIPYYNG